MNSNTKRRDPDQDHGAQKHVNHGHFILPNQGKVNPKRAERLARRLRRTEGRLIRLTCERERLARVLAGMAEGGAA